MKKEILSELIWLIAIAVISITCITILSGKFIPLNKTIDLQFHDTYFVISSFELFFTVFIIISTPVYLIKELIRKFKLFIPNLILSLVLISLIFLLFKWHTVAISLISFGNAWVIQPPDTEFSTLSHKQLKTWDYGFKIVEVILLLVLLILGIQVGRISVKRDY